jgi:outer membrane protein OmpA-like peptidoglycan-associated protein
VANNTGVITGSAPPTPYVPPVPPVQRVQDLAPRSMQRVSADLGCGRFGVFAGNMKAFLGPVDDDATRPRETECPTFQWKDLEADLPPTGASPANLSLPAHSTDLVEMPSQGVLRLYASPVLFKTGSYVISPEGRKYLSRFVEAVKTYPDPVDRIEIKGHADITGTPAFNLLLSKNRALAVQRYLTSQDLQYPLLAKGYGDTQPLEDCTGMAKAESVQCLQANRRVTLGIYIAQP